MVRFIMAQPANKYYSWQVEVLLNNMQHFNINLNYVDIVCKIDDAIPEEWDKLRKNYAARFFFYKDTRATKHYISSIRPNILKQHWERHPYLENEMIFYHDCDIIFTNTINWDYFDNDNIWYGSDTKWYISYDYIISKGQDVFDKMVEIVNIDPKIIIDNNENNIGAQYIMKNVDYDFWSSVEKDSENLFFNITQLNIEKKLKDKDYHEIQIWCADMWAVLWNSWKRGNVTKCHNELQFSWATSNEEDYYKYNIMHNAGVTSSKDGLFYKAEYMDRFPYNDDVHIKENTCSFHYFEWIQKTAIKSVLV